MPKLLLSSTFLVPIGFLADSRLDALIAYSLSFVMCLSFLGHKEWRFIVYTVPILNVAAARGARTLSVLLGSVGVFLTVENVASRCPKEFYLGEFVSHLSFLCFWQIPGILFSTFTQLWKITQGASLLPDSTSTTKTPITVYFPNRSLKLLTELSPSACTYIQFGSADRCKSIPSNSLRSILPFPSHSVFGAELDVQ